MVKKKENFHYKFKLEENEDRQYRLPMLFDFDKMRLLESFFKLHYALEKTVV